MMRLCNLPIDLIILDDRDDFCWILFLFIPQSYLRYIRGGCACQRKVSARVRRFQKYDWSTSQEESICAFCDKVDGFLPLDDLSSACLRHCRTLGQYREYNGAIRSLHLIGITITSEDTIALFR